MAKHVCPHCDKELKLASESHKETPKGTTESKTFRCPVGDCKYKYTETVVTEEGE